MKHKVILIIAVLLLVYPLNTFAKNNITVYMFTKKDEEISNQLKAYINSLKDVYNFETKEYIVWNENWEKDNKNYDLVEAVVLKYKKELLGAPIYVIGEHYFDEYNEEMNSYIETAIVEEMENTEYKDIVKDIQIKLQKQDSTNRIFTYCFLLGFPLIVTTFIFFTRKSIKKDSTI